MTPQPLVSIVMPVYKSTWFEAALISACEQTYRPLEIIVCDDSRGGLIAEIVERCGKRSAVPIRYQRNEHPLLEMSNTVEGIALASGHYVKILHDDDVLHPDCVEQLVAVMERDPGIALASSHRGRIDEAGQPLPDILATTPAFPIDVQIDGKALVSWWVDHTLNFIGEPSCVLCRRADLLALGDQLMSLNGQAIHWVGDLSLYAKLLQHGNLALLAEPLTDVRVSSEQFSQQGRDLPGIGNQGHADFRSQVRALGWYDPSTAERGVRVAALEDTEAVEQVDLFQRLNDRHESLRAEAQQREWFAARVPSPVQARLIDTRMQQHGTGPGIALVVLDPACNAPALEATLKSVAQLGHGYPTVQPYVISPQACEVEDVVTQINQILQQTPCRWLMLVEAGDCLTSSGLLIAGLELLEDPDCRAIYGDAMIAGSGDTLSAALRPDFNLDYLLSVPGVMARNWLFRCEALLEAGGFNPHFPAVLELEMILRLINLHGLAGFGHLSEPLVINQAPSFARDPELIDVLLSHLQGRGYAQASVVATRVGHFKINYGHPQQPRVSVVLVLGADLPALQRCLMSLLEQTHYPHYEVVIVDNACADGAASAWLQAIQQVLGARLQVVRAMTPLTHAAANNLGAEHALGEYLLFLRADTVLMQGQWLGELLNHGQRPEVGIVGAKSISTERTITHAGIILGLEGSAGHAFTGFPISSPGYMSRLWVDQNYTAVSDVCLLIRRCVFEEVAGLDLTVFEQGAADVDLCLRVAQLGYLTVWTPHSAVVHDHPQPAVPEAVREAFQQRWAAQLPRDPAYNSNLSLLEPAGFKLADPHLSWRPLVWKPLPVIMGRAADVQGCGHYRVIQPLDALKAAGYVDGALTYELPGLMHLERYAPDTLVMQRPLSETSLAAARQISQFNQAFKVYELDDYLPNLPVKSMHKARMPKDIMRSLRQGLSYVDRFVVSTDALAEALSGFHPDIHVVNNRLDRGWWGALPSSQRRTSHKPRVGWAGGSSHTGDLELIADVVKALADEVDWVFFGMCPDKVRPFVKEFHQGVRIDLYPAALARLNLDLAVAPLEDNLFNTCKSNLRLLEYGICGIPVVCSDNVCYRGDLPVTRVNNRFRDWVAAIRMHLHDLDASAAAGDVLRDCVRRNWMLDEAGLGQWRKAWLAG
ncbi:glycosyltransferase [Pseudomonas chlororaphis subsp. aurantiaca]|uniref:glycosyltransferase n=1 Tax=Pseudomonas chlororaphis TaxID=587753 RepID=UPI0027DDDBE9|nr:glycosyltransferase [Pseudomonas chlororaphis]WMJ03056.1 glycosyltransferase [Pseudomonas chlororaphis subsp. aurantiaca]